jgi:hypothetical protein
MMSRILGAVGSGALVLTMPVHAQKPALADLLSLAADYQASYASRVSGATLEERYALIQVVAGRMNTPVYFSSDVVLLNVNGRIIGMRDPFAVDNVPLRERTPRITTLLTAPTLEGWQKAQAYAAEQHFRFLADIILALNDPTVALQFVARDMQPKLTYKLEGHQTMNGVPVGRVGFKEIGNRDTRFTLGTRGNASASGRFWIDAATGAIHKSELWANSSTEAVVVNVTYAKDAALDLWLPQKTSETYEWKEMDDVSSNRNVGPYGARQFFQANATYTNPRYTPIDLSKMRR